MSAAGHMVSLGKTDLRVSSLGMGTWQWGEVRLWGFGKEYTQEDVEAAYHVSRAAGINFFDTAEIYGGGASIYGGGASETILGGLVRRDRATVVVGTKIAPLHKRWLSPIPGDWTVRSVEKALSASLARLGMSCVDLYQVHWPSRLIRIDALMNALADQVEVGKVRAVGVSNFSADQMYRAYSVLARRGIPLAANQVHFNLLHREPERSGLLAACHELGVQLIAFSPLEQGILTGKYHEGTRVASDLQRFLPTFRPDLIGASTHVIHRLRHIGELHGGKTPGQVALNWLICRGALPIPGAKTTVQATSNAGALGWELADEEVEELSELRV